MVPDGLGVWQEGERRITFCLEYDRSTEPLARPADKLRRYEKLRAAVTDPFVVLFSFATARREASARQALAKTGLPLSPRAHVGERGGRTERFGYRSNLP